MNNNTKPIKDLPEVNLPTPMGDLIIKFESDLQARLIIGRNLKEIRSPSYSSPAEINGRSYTVTANAFRHDDDAPWTVLDLKIRGVFDNDTVSQTWHDKMRQLFKKTVNGWACDNEDKLRRLKLTHLDNELNRRYNYLEEALKEFKKVKEEIRSLKTKREYAVTQLVTSGA